MKRKKIAILIVIVAIMFNIILPKNIQATVGVPADVKEASNLEGETGGGSLLEPISQFLCYIFDAIIDLLQDMFVTPERIRLEDGTYSIKYSPGVIFSGKVPALDINFINPGEKKNASISYTEYVSLVDALNLNGAKELYNEQYTNRFRTKAGIIRDIKKDKTYEYDETREIDKELFEGKLQSNETEYTTGPFSGSTWNSGTHSIECIWHNEAENKMYIIVNYFEMVQSTDPFQNSTITKLGIVYLYEIETTQINNTTGEEIEIVYTKEYNSSAGILQKVVSTWYNILRRVALVGLLSVIVYIGIRILLTSTSAKDKAKYKSMLKDWLIALCLLFTLHYIMSITITVVTKINEVIKASSIAANGEDILMTSVRNMILNGQNWSTVLTYVVIYSVLVVYTIIYTIQYIRRIIYLAFLTMIAPLITLTYPLDKIKDSKSQAFDMWIKDYIFFTLIQVVHLLIYYIFLGSAINLNQAGNWLYAIVAIGFITPAEKLIKSMFGFEKSKTLGAMGAGATGALVMNAIQKIPQGGAKGKSSGAQNTSVGGSTKLVRTAGVNPFVTSPDSSSTVPSSSSGSSQTGGNSGNSGGGNTNTSSNTSGGGQQPQTKNPQSSNNKKKAKKSSAKTSGELSFGMKVKGARAVAGKYFKPAASGAIRIMSGATGAVLGVSAAIAKGGELSDIATGIAIGTKAGDSIANIAMDSVKKVGEIPEKVNNVVDVWREGAYGTEIAQNAKFDRVFRSSREYTDLRDSSGFSEIEFDKKVQTMLNNGIKDTKQMKKILKNHKKDPKKYSMENAIKYAQLAEKCTEDILYDKAKFIRFCEAKKLGISEEELVELRKIIINFK